MIGHKEAEVLDGNEADQASDMLTTSGRLGLEEETNAVGNSVWQTMRSALSWPGSGALSLTVSWPHCYTHGPSVMPVLLRSWALSHGSTATLMAVLLHSWAMSHGRTAALMAILLHSWAMAVLLRSCAMRQYYYAHGNTGTLMSHASWQYCYTHGPRVMAVVLHSGQSCYQCCYGIVTAAFFAIAHVSCRASASNLRHSFITARVSCRASPAVYRRAAWRRSKGRH